MNVKVYVGNTTKSIDHQLMYISDHNDSLAALEYLGKVEAYIHKKRRAIEQGMNVVRASEKTRHGSGRK